GGRKTIRGGDVREAVAVLGERDRGRADGILVCAAVRSSSLLTCCFCAPRAGPQDASVSAWGQRPLSPQLGRGPQTAFEEVTLDQCRGTPDRASAQSATAGPADIAA